MTTDLDPRGLEAARAKCAELRVYYGPENIAAIIAAYLEATRPEGEADRIAVVVEPCGRAFGATYRQATPIDQFVRLERMLTLEGGAEGPFARVIIECRLPRPAEPVTVQGRVT